MTVERGRIARDHRPQRRRQDHVLQPDQRLPAAELRPHYFRRRGHHRSVAGAPGMARHRPHVPGHRSLSRAFGARKSAHCGRSRVRLSRCGRGCRAAPTRRSRARVAELLDMGGLAAKATDWWANLPHGDQRATEIMMALALKPRLLLLDEPTAGMGDQETYDDHPAHPPPAQGQQADDRADRARHARRLPSCRPHHGARSGQFPRRRHAAGDRRATRRCRPPIWARPHERRTHRRRAAYLLRQEPHPARRQPRGRRRPGDGAARPQRRRQDHDAAQPHGTDNAARRPRHHLRHRDHALAAVPRRRAWRRLRSRRPQDFSQSHRR